MALFALGYDVYSFYPEVGARCLILTIGRFNLPPSIGLL